MLAGSEVGFAGFPCLGDLDEDAGHEPRECLLPPDGHGDVPDGSGVGDDQAMGERRGLLATCDNITLP